jgi:hypothetical protein
MSRAKTYLLTCSCGNTKRKHWHLACAQCWNLVPTDLQERVYHLFKTRKGSEEHMQAIRECYQQIHTKRRAAAAKEAA